MRAGIPSLSFPLNLSTEPLCGGKHFVSAFQLTFPHRKDAPPQRSQRTSFTTIAGTVRVDLGKPERYVRGGTAPGATLVPVPKASMNKDRDSVFRQNDVGSASQLAHVQSKPEAHAVKLPPEFLFRCSVPLPHTRHADAALALREDIDHLSRCKMRCRIMLTLASSPEKTSYGENV
jgi:hypothetical protein